MQFSVPFNQGHYEGGKGSTIPRASCHYGGAELP